jgi:DNA-binding Lrp family transcriptional regulator
MYTTPIDTELVTVDGKDRKILYYLDLNARQSVSQLGKKISLPKNVVAYRIKRLYEKGIIRSFFTVINPFRLGYTSFGFYFVFQYATTAIKQEIIDYFVNNKSTWFVASIDGYFDVGISVWVKELNEFYHVWEDILEKYRYYIEDHTVINFVQTHSYRHTYLLDKCSERDRQEFICTGAGPLVKIDQLDYQLLHLLADNARMTIIDLAETLHSSSTTIRYRMKKLEKMGVIQGYRIAIDITQLGFKDFRIDMDLKDYDKRDTIVRYIAKNPCLTYIFSSIGHADLQFHIRVRHLDDVHTIMSDLNEKFPQIIRDYRYVHIPKIYKQNYMPGK